MTPVWVDTYLGLMFQIQGLTFVMLGIAALLSIRRDSTLDLGAHLGWLAGFGMLHGLQAFIDGERLHNPAAWLLGLSSALMVLSFVALLEFGRRLWNERPGGRRVAALPLYAAAGLGTVALMLATSTITAGLELGARYLLGAPGAAWAGIGLFARAQATARAPDTADMIFWLRVAALALLGYAALTLLLSPGSGRLLAGWLPTTEDFLATTGLPVQSARALCAVLLTSGFIVVSRRIGDLTITSLRRVTGRLDGFVYRCRNDHDWTVTFMSEGGENLTGYPARDFLLGKLHFADLIHPDDQQRVWDGVQAALAARSDFRMHYRMRDRAGTVRQCYEEGRGVFSAQGELLHLEGLVRNDDKRYQAEEARRRFQTLVEASPQPVGWADPEGTVHYVNKAMRTLLALPEGAEAPPYQVRDFYDDEVFALVESTVLPIALAEGEWTGELPMRSFSGHTVPTLHSIFTLLDDTGQVSAIANMIIDLTEIRQAQAAVAESELRYRQLFEQTSDGIVYADRESANFVDANQSFADMLGCQREDIAQLSVRDIHPESALPHALQQFSAMARGEISTAEDIPVLRRDGSVFFADISGLSQEQDGRSLLVGVFRDVSERRTKAQRIQDLNSELEARVQERTAELERANAAKSDFLSRMSHELRTPLNAILGFTQILQIPDEQPLTSQQEDNVREIHRAGEHLLTLVNEILDLARIDSGRLKISTERVAICPLIEHCAVQIGPAARKRGIQPTLHMEPLCTVWADPVRLQQVLLNLLSNAVKYNRENGCITIDCSVVADQRVRVSVRDTGPGLNDEQQQRLFRPFERIESAYEGIDGTGIGLALAKQLVEGMQGRIGVDSQPGAGSTFWFELPLCDAPNAEREPGSTRDPASGSTAPPMIIEPPKAGRQPHKVLCVEDNAANLHLIRKILSTLTDIDLHTAMTAEDGLLLAQQELPDLILLDINLPGRSGYQVLEVLKADPGLKDIPVIAITANAMPRDIERGRAAGFVDYLTKPLDIRLFIETVSRCLAERPVDR